MVKNEINHQTIVLATAENRALQAIRQASQITRHDSHYWHCNAI